MSLFIIFVKSVYYPFKLDNGKTMLKELYEKYKKYGKLSAESVMSKIIFPPLLTNEFGTVWTTSTILDLHEE